MNTTTPEKPLGDFTRFIGTPFETFILPNMPLDAVLAADSKVDPANRGRLPGSYRPDTNEWVGFYHWQFHQTTPQELAYWNMLSSTVSRLPVAMRLNEFHAVDCDVNHEGDMMEITTIIQEFLGFGPVRSRPNSPRKLFFFKKTPGHDTPPVMHVPRITYTHPDGSEHTIEILGHGHACTLEGPHRSGVDYEWLFGDIVTWQQIMPLPDLDGNKAFALINRLKEWVEAKGYTIKKGTLPTFNADREEFEVNDPDSPLVAPDLMRLGEALQAIDINCERLADYDSWIGFMHALKGACGGDQAFYGAFVERWMLQHPGNEAQGPEWCQTKWNSIERSSLGAEVVFQMARSQGWNDGGEFARNIFASAPQTQNSSEIVARDGTELGESQSRPGLPGDTQFDVADRFIAIAGRFWKFSHERGHWYSWQTNIWDRSDHIGSLIKQICVQFAENVATRDNTPAQRIYSLQSAGFVKSVETLLRDDPRLAVREEQFDANPYWLNTPGGVVNLRTGEMFEAQPEMLMRRITLCAPAVMLRGCTDEQYAVFMPKFWGSLQGHINSREGYLEAVRAWGGNLLFGHVLFQGIFVTVGEPGNGKSMIIQVFKNIDYSYARMLSEAILSKNGDQGTKRFEKSEWPGRRWVFKDELQQGMHWDETSMCEIATGAKLFTDVKHGRGIEFTNNTKMVIVGNHCPHFVSPEAGGLASRIHLFKSEGPVYRDTLKDKKGLHKIISDDEGPVILQWRIDEAVRLHQEEGRWQRATQPLRDAGKAYAREDSSFEQWLVDQSTHGIVQHEQAEMWLSAAFQSYREFAKDIDRKPLSQANFRAALEARFKVDGQFLVRIERWSKHDEHWNASVIRGLGPKEMVDLNIQSGNVIPFPGADRQHRPSASGRRGR
jgi:phage/plasmid-associated DNA primase